LICYFALLVLNADKVFFFLLCCYHVPSRDIPNYEDRQDLENGREESDPLRWSDPKRKDLFYPQGKRKALVGRRFMTEDEDTTKGERRLHEEVMKHSKHFPIAVGKRGEQHERLMNFLRALRYGDQTTRTDGPEEEE